MDHDKEYFDWEEEIEEITEEPKEKEKKERKKPSPDASQRPSSASRKKRKRKKKKKKKNMLYLHTGIIAFIALIALIGTIKLVRWNRGIQSDYDPDEINTEFDTETEDYLLPLTKDMADLRIQDDVLTVLMLGNNVLAKDSEGVTIASCLRELSGANVIDASIDRTFLSTKHAVYDDDYPGDLFSLYWLSYCMAERNFQLLESNAPRFEGDDHTLEKTELLKDLDMNAVDVIVIMYDFHDFEDRRMLTTPYDTQLPGSCCGSLLQSVTLLKNAFPHIRIILSSPYYCYVEDENHTPVPCETLDLGNGTLADYMIAYKNIAVDSGICFIDHYIGTINADNYSQYLDENFKYPNREGKLAIAARINDFLA